MPLETLDDVPWHQLHHAYGPADDVPETLRALVGEDAEERRQAISELYGNIFHQGTRYEATIQAIPYLLELAANPDVPDRAEILVLLAHVALGYPDDLFIPWGIDPDNLRQALTAADQSMTAEERDDCRTYRFGPAIDLACYDGVQTGLLPLVPLITDDDERIQCAAAYLLAWFRDLAPSSLPVLLDAVSDARSDWQRAHALIAIGLLSGDRLDRNQADDLAMYCAPAHSLLVRSAAAIAIFRSPLEDAALEVLIEALLGARSLSFRSDELLFNEGNLAGHVALMLSDAPGHMHDRLVPALCSVLETVNPYQSLDVTRALLDLITGEASMRAGFFEHRSASELTELQRMALGSIRDNGGWKYGTGDFVNYAELIEYYGLPRRLEWFQTYLEG